MLEKSEESPHLETKFDGPLVEMSVKGAREEGRVLALTQMKAR